MQANLFVVEEDMTMFRTKLVSLMTGNGQFTLGQKGGDDDDYLFGNTSGYLIEGRRYGLFFQAYMIQNRDPSDAGASAIGNVTLAITAVPEPASVTVWSLLGMAGIGYGWQRKRRSR